MTLSYSYWKEAKTTQTPPIAKLLHLFGHRLPELNIMRQSNEHQSCKLSLVEWCEPPKGRNSPLEIQ